jgi:tRNA-splicing ligase RtcB
MGAVSGAGRPHFQTAAKRLSTRDDRDARMDGIAWGRSDALVDEHRDAYKDIASSWPTPPTSSASTPPCGRS